MTQSDLADTAAHRWRGFEALSVDECRRLLGTARIGRLGITAGALPVVLPVAYEAQDGHVQIRTPGNHELDGRQLDGQIVAFEVDELDLDRGCGWCVSVTGRIRAAAENGTAPASAGWFTDGATLSLDVDLVTGHRLVV